MSEQAAAMLMSMQAAAKLASAINTVIAEIFQNQIQNTVHLSSVADYPRTVALQYAKQVHCKMESSCSRTSNNNYLC
jgi:hypothetical protein